jgi:hypothetical protein
MRQAVTTKYLGPTNFRGARIAVKSQAGRHVVSWDHALNVAANHERAALVYIAMMGWAGHWAGGALPDDTGYCFVNAQGYSRAPENIGNAVYAVEAGRIVTCNGAPFVGVTRELASPTDADQVAHRLAHYLNMEVR